MTHLLTLHHSPSQPDVELSERGCCLQTTNCLIWFNDKANSHNFEGRCSNISQSDSLIFCICLQIKTVILYKYFVYSKSRIKMLFLFPSINQHQIWFTLLITDIPQQKSSSPSSGPARYWASQQWAHYCYKLLLLDQPAPGISLCRKCWLFARQWLRYVRLLPVFRKLDCVISHLHCELQISGEWATVTTTTVDCE